MRWPTIGICAAFTLLAACGNGIGLTGSGGGLTGSQTSVVQHPRPNGAPDVVIFSVSGHEGAVSAFACTSGDNFPYLGEPGSARAVIEQTFLDLGYTLYTIDFSDRLGAHDTNNNGAVDAGDHLGFDQLLFEMQFVFDNYIDGIANPTRIVLVGHSHGANWMHLATAAVSHIPVDHMISLDAICFLWECELSTEVADWLQTAALNPLVDISEPCDSVTVQGKSSLQDVKDVVFDHVRYNIEIHSSDFFTSDCCSNTRLDGTTTDIVTWQSPESHSAVDAANSSAMTWVVEQIREIDANR
ncbi:MAG: hypothetical protein V3T86_00935 [Planctomycetota bacterium]